MKDKYSWVGLEMLLQNHVNTILRGEQMSGPLENVNNGY